MPETTLSNSERYDILRTLDDVSGSPVVVKRVAQGADGDASWPELLNESVILARLHTVRGCLNQVP